MLPRRLDPLLRHLSVAVLIAGAVAFSYELFSDHRAAGAPPLSASP